MRAKKIKNIYIFGVIGDFNTKFIIKSELY